MANIRPPHALSAGRAARLGATRGFHHGLLSPGTADRDIGPKFAEYEQHGVIEYWVLDPATLAHRFYRRGGELLVEYAEQDARIASRVVAGFFVLREWLDPARTPPISESLARIEG